MQLIPSFDWSERASNRSSGGQFGAFPLSFPTPQGVVTDNALLILSRGRRLATR